MTRGLRIVRTGSQVALVDRRKGRTFLFMLALEASLFTILVAKLSRVVSSPSDLIVPVVACAFVMIWTASHISRDLRLSVDTKRRCVSMVETCPLTGRRWARHFGIDEVEGLAMRQILPGVFNLERAPDSCRFTLELRGGGHFILASRASMLACRDTASRFAAATGIGTRIERLPAR
jgi:hypothetical protein